MTALHACILGIIQGICEFFPISSSAHIKIAKHLLGIPMGESVLFDLSCHMGTLTALIIAMRSEIHNALQEALRSFLLFFCALIPLIPFYFLLKPVRTFLGQDQFLGFCLIATAGILYIGQKIKIQSESIAERKRDALWIGACQAIALIPGISRSASTISCARVLGWNIEKAVRFSFLLSIPTIIGGALLESLALLRNFGNHAEEFHSCLLGFAMAACAGLFVVRYALRILDKGNYKPFIWYCAAIGIFATIYLNFT